MEIKHNSYHEGKVQSLGFTYDDKNATIGIFQPGEYDFGIASEREQMKVVHGTLTYPPTNETYSEQGPQQTLTIEKDQPIKFSCQSPVAYVCYYG